MLSYLFTFRSAAILITKKLAWKLLTIFAIFLVRFFSVSSLYSDLNYHSPSEVSLYATVTNCYACSPFQAQVSLHRLQEFLKLDELRKDNVIHSLPLRCRYFERFPGDFH